MAAEEMPLKARNLEKAVVQKTLSETAFMSSINNLTLSINELMKLFKEATEEMKIEEEAQASLKSKIEPLLSKMEELESQNTTIAQSILALADMIKDLSIKLEGRQPLPRHMPMAPINEQAMPEMPQIPKKILPEPPRQMLQTKEKMPYPEFNSPRRAVPETGKPFIRERQLYQEPFTSAQNIPPPPRPVPPPFHPNQQPKLTPVMPPFQEHEPFGEMPLPPEKKKGIMGKFF